MPQAELLRTSIQLALSYITVYTPSRPSNRFFAGVEVCGERATTELVEPSPFYPRGSLIPAHVNRVHNYRGIEPRLDETLRSAGA